MLHPIVGLFPHANSAELFVYLGVAAGFGKVGNQSELGLRYLLAAFMIILVRGIITEKIARFLTQREAKKTTEA